MPNVLNIDHVDSYTYMPCGAGSTAANIFAVGDLLFWDPTNEVVRQASDFTWDTSEKLTRQQFRRLFVGVAMEANFSDSVARLVKVATVCMVTVTCTSSTGGPTSDDTLSCVGPESSASLLLDQKVELVRDPSEAIGTVIRRHTAAVTSIKCLLFSTLQGAPAARTLETRTKIIYLAAVTAAVDRITNVPAQQFFGGAAEVLALGFQEQVAITTKALKLNLEKGTTNLATLTVALTGAAIGRYSEADMSSDTSRFFTANTNISLEVGTTAPSAGAGNVFIRYRPLF